METLSNLSHFGQASFCMLFQTAINWNHYTYKDLPQTSFSERLKKARLIAGLSQKQLSLLTSVSQSTINELECCYRDNISKDTLLKLSKILDRNILYDNYLIFIVNQKELLTIAKNKYGSKYLCKTLNIHRSTLERWICEKYQVKRNQYIKLTELGILS